MVINADDYYGKEAYQVAYQFLTEPKEKSFKLPLGMVSFVLENTLSENGGVTRGICQVDESGYLKDIRETHNIEKAGDKAVAREDKEIELDLKVPVSMNMWALQPEMFAILEEEFVKFLADLAPDDLKTEYLLPTIIGGLLAENRVSVKVLQSHDNWFGVTYKEDKDSVVKSIQQLIKEGIYPQKLF